MIVIFQELKLAKRLALVAPDRTGGGCGEGVVEVGFTELNGRHPSITGVVDSACEFVFRLDADNNEVWVFRTGWYEVLTSFQRGVTRLDRLNCSREVASDENVQIRCVFSAANLRSVHEILQVRLPAAFRPPAT